MKSRIIKKLKSQKNALSEKQFARDLDVSDVSLKTHIRELQEAGYAISKTSNGYCLTNDPDVLFPWEFHKYEAQIHYVAETESTMNIARDMAKQQYPHFTVVIADRQTKGRGRLKRTWISEKGGLYFTIILRPDFHVSQAHIINFAASLSLAKILQNNFDLNARVKWPNDVLVNDKKISGLLSEMETDEESITYVNIGIGINVNNDPTMEEPNATSLKNLLKKEIQRKTILSLFLDEFKESLSLSETNKIIHQWKEYTMTLGKEVRVATNRETTQGTALDVDDSGALMIKLRDGTIKRVIYGDCFVQ